MTTELATHIEVENLTVNPRTKRELAIGDSESFVRIASDTSGISAILWNEEYLALVTKDPATIITYRPEFNPTIAMFFMRDEKRERYSFNGAPFGARVWEGDYSPVKFTKSNLLKFLKEYAQSDTAPIVESVKQMKITESKTRTETMISLDDENFQATEEQILKSNIPTKFSLEVPLIDTINEKVIVTLNFEAEVVTVKEEWGEPKGRKAIQLRCIDARKVLHNVMQDYVKRLPENIPRYYGKLILEALKS